MTDNKDDASQKPEIIQEIQLTWAGKLFFAGVAAYLAGVGLEKFGKKAPPKFPLKIRGTPQQIQAITSAIVSSAAFQREASKAGATVDGVIQKLHLSNMNKQRFEQLTGKPWPIK